MKTRQKNRKVKTPKIVKSPLKPKKKILKKKIKSTVIANTFLSLKDNGSKSQITPQTPPSKTTCSKDGSSNIDSCKRKKKKKTPKNLNKSKKLYTMISDDVIVIDDDGNNDSNVQFEGSNESFLEMEKYHNAFRENDSKLMDSIICIDDEDLPSQSKLKSVEKSSTHMPGEELIEDCFVVWSSLPESATTSTSITTSKPGSSFNRLPNDPNILTYDKIFLDTTADMTNLRYLDENNVPKKRKTSKIEKSLSKSHLKVKPVKNSVKKKIDGELIFQSESCDSPSSSRTIHKKGSLREVVIDGNNVAMAFNNNKNFSEKGIKLLIDYFTKKGHTVKVFVPQYRRSFNFPSLEKWNKEGIVVFTPSRKLGNKNFTPYDDRYILEYATACGGIVVSQDQFRDLYAEKPEYKDTIENRLLPPTFVGNYVMFPEDPLGRDGPKLADFLKH